MTMNESVIDVAVGLIRDAGRDIAVDELSVPDGYTTKQILSALGNAARSRHLPIIRVGRGVYRYDQNAKTQTSTMDSTPEDLKPLTEGLSEAQFEVAGLVMVARSTKGGYVCLDENGVAWLVEVTATARML